MRQLFSLIFIILITDSSFCQKENDNDEYFNMVVQFFKLLNQNFVSIKDCDELFGEYSLEVEEFLFFKECDSINNELECNKSCENRFNNPIENNSLLFEQFIKVRDQFFPVKLDSINIIIHKAIIYDEENSNSIALDVRLQNGKILYFYFDKFSDEPLSISNIYLYTGESIFSYLGISEKEYLHRKGIINDMDEYAFIREKPDKDSKIITKVLQNEPFYFVPNVDSLWWKVKNYDNSINGYMFWNRITPVGTLPGPEQQRFGAN